MATAPRGTRRRRRAQDSPPEAQRSDVVTVEAEQTDSVMHDETTPERPDGPDDTLTELPSIRQPNPPPGPTAVSSESGSPRDSMASSGATPTATAIF